MHLISVSVAWLSACCSDAFKIAGPMAILSMCSSLAMIFVYSELMPTNHWSDKPTYLFFHTILLGVLSLLINLMALSRDIFNNKGSILVSNEDDQIIPSIASVYKKCREKRQVE